MPDLRTRLRDELRSAMKAGDTVRRDTIRLLEAAIKNAEIERRGELEEAELVAVLQKQARQREESIEQYRAGRREDLAEKESAELAVIQEYLPRQMSEEEVREAARAAIARVGASGPGDKGKVMGPLMAELRGKADGRLVNAVVSELLRA